MEFKNGMIDRDIFKRRYIDAVKKIIDYFTDEGHEGKYLIAENAYNVAIQNIESFLGGIKHEILDEQYASIICYELCSMHIVHITDEIVLQNEICQNINCWAAVVVALRYIYGEEVGGSLKSDITEIVKRILYRHTNREDIENWFKDNH